jgi:hypothetical protein
MSNHRPVSAKSGKRVNLTGSCLCGKVRYKINGVARDIINCFCQQCRKTSGHYVAATRVSKDQFEIIDRTFLTWFKSSPGTFRGFCSQCGGNLFWDGGTDDQIGIMAGSLDEPTGLKTIENIFVEDASDYCDIPLIDLPNKLV